MSAEHSPIISASITRVRAGRAAPADDWLAREEPLEIRVRGRSIAVTMRTPGHDEELACGFLLSEGLLRRRSDLLKIAPCAAADSTSAGNILNVFLSPKLPLDLDRLTRHVFASSSCGVCGKATIESVHLHFQPLPRAAKKPLRISAELLCALPEKLRARQAAFAQTGGLHAAAIFDARGRLLVLREDAGRHNAVDKVLGWAFLHSRLPLARHILLVSGRASFEIMQKALAARLPIVAAVSAPSSLAVDFARESGQTLAAFLRGDTFNLYAHPQRIALPAP